ncbi:hypothetical protein LINPERPRIM_LOCUS3488 [Linum perenne]
MHAIRSPHGQRISVKSTRNSFDANPFTGEEMAARQIRVQRLEQLQTLSVCLSNSATSIAILHRHNSSSTTFDLTAYITEN